MSNETWNCPNCGKKEVISNFCPDCGTRKPETKKTLTPEEIRQKSEEEREQLRKKLLELIKNGPRIFPTKIQIPPNKFYIEPLLTLMNPEEIRKGRNVLFGTERRYIPEFRRNINNIDIEWCVLDVDLSDNTALLVSEYGLKEMRFDAASNNWSNSEIRKWLNETFYNRFTPGEQARIISRPNGDKVFLLGKEEVEYFFTGDSERICYPHGKDCAVCWWLRSPGSYPNFAMYVDRKGVVCDGSFVHLANCYVRPAILVKF